MGAARWLGTVQAVRWVAGWQAGQAAKEVEELWVGLAGVVKQWLWKAPQVKVREKAAGVAALRMMVREKATGVMALQEKVREKAAGVVALQVMVQGKAAGVAAAQVIAQGVMWQALGPSARELG